VLTHGELDNGRGHARQKLFTHKHEVRMRMAIGGFVGWARIWLELEYGL
jgi:GTPase